MPQGLDDGLRDPIQRPALAPELQRIQVDHATLASTGCTKDFCQAGRALHTDEPRVGENRALSIVEQEAEHYLQDLHVECFFDSEDAFQSQLEEILEFAGYEAEDGSIIGDPNSVKLTKAIIELGWVRPESRSPWHLLPLVAIAEGDLPAFTEIPTYLRPLMNIHHPQYAAQFEKLGLKWVSFPALTRLGFDIGGVQYTATPFLGWYV
ncbi:hypothetical protein OEA41_010084 [Lepraria neglecta]|uniref:nitric-oxide synthase (NADPH) n=1 Tax=Lepraria neglecta TaxID=209136 RepID=A0AAE0DEZ4_9LECA|nr:hypothetical protein OEA41_010084 [Lepraria neglecta]